MQKSAGYSNKVLVSMKNKNIYSNKYIGKAEAKYEPPMTKSDGE